MECLSFEWCVFNILIKWKHALLLHLYMFFWILFPDYESLRIGGMIFAVILFLMGIFLIVSECQTLYCSQKELYLCIVLAIRYKEYFSKKDIHLRMYPLAQINKYRLLRVDWLHASMSFISSKFKLLYDTQHRTMTYGGPPVQRQAANITFDNLETPSISHKLLTRDPADLMLYRPWVRSQQGCLRTVVWFLCTYV